MKKGKHFKRLWSLMLLLIAMLMPQGAWAISGNGTASSPYLIANEADLRTFQQYVENGNSGIYGKLTADITLTSAWTRIGRADRGFTGYFDGQGHTISGMNLSFTAYEHGFFGFVNNATIKNFTLTGTMTSSANGNHSHGTVVGSAAGTTVIENVTSSVNLTLNHTGFTCIGGIVGHMADNTRVTGCTYTGTINLTKDSEQVGGIVGYAQNDLYITNNVFSGTITSTGTCKYLAGIAGKTDGTIEVSGCTNIGTINGGPSYDCVAGIVGYVQYQSRALITNCYFGGSLSSTSSGTSLGMGGILGAVNDDAGTNFRGLTYCFSDGTLTATNSSSTQIGGIAGVIKSKAVSKVMNNTYLSGTASRLAAISNNSSSFDSSNKAITISVTAGTGGTFKKSYVYPTSTTATQLQVEATPNSGYHYVKWSDNGAQTHNVSLANNVSLTATFGAHTYGDWITDVAATCTSAGTHHRVCTYAGCGAREDGTIAALGHGSTGYTDSYSWTGNAYNNASQDTKACIFTLTCKKCSTKVVNGASLPCTKTAHVDATCTATGSTTYQATGSYTAANSAYNYSATKTNVYTVAALGHGTTGYTDSYSWTGNAYNDASQDTKACTFTLTCKKCSTKVVNGASLTCIKTAHVDATCRATGSTTYQATGSYTSSNSAYNYSATKTNVYTVAALGHLWHDDRQDLCDRCNHTFLYYEHTGKISLQVNGRFYNSENKQVTAYHTYDNNTHIGTIEIYDIVVKIYDVFDWGSTVTSVKIPHTVKELHGTFYQCKGLNSVTLYEGLESISVNTFNKTPLSSITLPHSLKYIDGSAFQNCNNLTSLVMQSVPQIDGVWQSGRNTTETVVLAEDSYVYKDSNPNFPTVASVTAPCALDLTGSAVENHPNLIHTGGQKIVDAAAVAPTCTTDGHTEGAHCNLCDKPLTVQQTIPATGHSFNNKTLTAEAVEDALYAYVCDNGCGEQSDAHVIKDYDGAGNNLELTKEASGNYTAYSVAIEDGKSFSTPVPFITKNVMMNRSFTDGIPSTIMLPFSIDASDFGDESPWGEKLGCFFFKFQSVTRNAETGKWEAIMTRVTDVIAYTPYVIVMYKTSTLDFGWNYNTMTFPATPAASGMITADAETDWTLVGLNEKKVWTDGDEEIGKAYGFAGKNKDYDEYAVAKGDFVKIAAGASAKPGRCYLLKDGALVSSAKGMTRAAVAEELPSTITVRFIDGDTTTGISTLNTETGEMTTVQWYDLNGRRIEKPTKGGIYIKNNKKVLVK